MSNVKEVIKTSRRIRKGYEKRVDHLYVIAALRYKTKFLTDGIWLESPGII